jgi:hypothetical protein
MKKLFSILIMIVLVFTLSGCEESDNVQALQSRIEDLEEENVTLKSDMDDLQSMIASFETSLNEDKVIFTTESKGTTEAVNVSYEEDGDKTLLDLLDFAYDIEYTESDFGVFLNEVESVHATSGNSIEISKNGDPMTVGISDAEFTGGDHFHFELSWYDETLKSVDESLNLFIDNQIDEYTNDHQVVLGISHLGILNDYSIEVAEVGNEATAGTLIKHIFIKASLGEDVSALQDNLNQIATTDYLYTVANTYLALSLNNDTMYKDFEEAFKTKLDDIDVSNTDNDTLSMVLMAIEVMNESAYDTLETSIIEHLKTNAYNNSYGNNAASFAQIILGLLAVGEDPASDAYLENGKTLVEHLLAYQTDEGAFLYQLEDESADLDFSTPQAFFALAAYQASLNNDDFLHPYGVN